ncbi:MAG TPA: NAD-binding protein [Micromonosporaceae bacterium]|nr:NAD-binding protein [Micromonosporaceae bacterium]
MKVIISGAGRFGRQAAAVLTAAGHQVTLIDIDDDRITELGDVLVARLVAGDACEPTVLEEAGAHTADLLIAATGDDEDNLVIGLLAKRQFAVPRVAARVNDPDNAWLFDHRWGIDVALPAATPLISLIEEATGAADTVALLRLAKAGVTVIETAITAQSRTCGRTLADITMPAGTLVVALIRDGTTVIPTSHTALRPGDELLVITHTADTADVHAAFQ